MASTDVVHEFLQLFRLYKDGRVERFLGGTEGFAGGLKLQGMVLLHPYFGGEERDELVAFQ
ncbi:putative gibberellin receptor GID1L3 [Sesbania bispinosa]|nr:putative gibberellin receptor GID1L3 [Sesbania bispinosa]